MPTFSDQVQALCEAVFTAKCARASAAARLKADLAANCRERSDNCRERSEQVQAFRDRVRSEHRAAADRLRRTLQQNEQDRQQTVNRLRRTLQQNQQDRQQTVNSMLESFDQAQRAVGEQCQAASRAWREMQERTVGSC